MIDSLFAIMI